MFFWDAIHRDGFESKGMKGFDIERLTLIINLLTLLKLFDKA